jgi:hypothetical protein
MAYIKKQCNSIAKEVADGKEPEQRKAPDDDNGSWVRPKEVGLFKHVDPVYGEQHQAAFKAAMAAGRELHEKGKVAEDAVVATALIGQLGQKCLEKEAKKRAKEAEKGAKKDAKKAEKKQMAVSGK